MRVGCGLRAFVFALRAKKAWAVPRPASNFKRQNFNTPRHGGQQRGEGGQGGAARPLTHAQWRSRNLGCRMAREAAAWSGRRQSP